MKSKNCNRKKQGVTPVGLPRLVRLRVDPWFERVWRKGGGLTVGISFHFPMVICLPDDTDWTQYSIFIGLFAWVFHVDILFRQGTAPLPEAPGKQQAPSPAPQGDICGKICQSNNKISHGQAEEKL